MPAPAAVCPNCGAARVGGGDFVSWCSACDWNVDPNPPAAPRSRLTGWWESRQDRLAVGLYDQVAAPGGLRGRGTLVDLLVLLLAGLVHLVTAAVLVLGVLVLVSDLALFIRLVLAGVLLGIFASVQPILLRRRGRVGHVELTRSKAPALFGLLDRVAAAAGTKNVERVWITARYNAAYLKDRRRRPVVEIGIPLWVVLTPQQRIGVLGHEMGHRVNGDLRDLAYVSFALTTLRRWLYLLRPISTRPRVQTWSPYQGLVMLADALLPIVLLPFTLAILAFGSVLDLLGQRQGQRAEYVADQVAARVAGSDAYRGSLNALLISNACWSELARIIQFRRRENPWFALQQFVESIPDSELERLRRAAAKRLDRIDVTHPPSYLRAELIGSSPRREPTVEVDAETWDAVSRELSPAAGAAMRALQSSLGVV